MELLRLDSMRNETLTVAKGNSVSVSVPRALH
jgi:hypothetical protein